METVGGDPALKYFIKKIKEGVQVGGLIVALTDSI